MKLLCDSNLIGALWVCDTYQKRAGKQVRSKTLFFKKTIFAKLNQNLGWYKSKGELN